MDTPKVYVKYPITIEGDSENTEYEAVDRLSSPDFKAIINSYLRIIEQTISISLIMKFYISINGDNLKTKMRSLMYMIIYS